MEETSTTTCPSLDEIEAFLSDGRDEHVRRHVAHCPVCRRAANDIRANNELLGDFRAVIAGGPRPHPGVTPEQIGAYRLLGEIHRGGQGVVYKAVHTTTRRTVAIKMLTAGCLATAKQRARFDREIEIISGLRHRHVVTLYEMLELPDGRTAYAMEYVDGAPLDQWIRAGLAGDDSPTEAPRPDTRPRVDAILTLAISICEAVAYAHQHGVIHRDLKPGNILVDRAGEPHILDFGLAKALGSDQLNHTQTGEFMGTVAYAAPEQVQGVPQAVDTRADVYALGMILFEALCGRRPLQDEGPLADLLRQITHVDPQPPSSLNPALNDEIDTIILKALAKDPQRRYQSAGALAADLRHYLDGQPLDAKRDSAWYMLTKTVSRHRWPLAAAAAALFMLTAFAITMSFAYRRTAVAERGYQEKSEQLTQLLAESNIERAKVMLSSGNIPLAERLLWSELAPRADSLIGPDAPPLNLDRRYWALWELYSKHPCLATSRREGVRATWIHFDQSTDSVIALYTDGVVWRIPLGAGQHIELGRIKPPSRAREATLAEIGDRLVFLDEAGRIKRHDLKTFAFVDEIDLGDADAVTAALDANQRHAAYVDGRGRLWCVDLQSGQRVVAEEPLSAARGGLIRIKLSPDNRTIVASSGTNVIQAFRVESGAIRSLWKRTLGFPASFIALSPRGDRIATETVENAGAVIHVLDIETGRTLSSIVGSTAKIAGLEFSRDGSRLASCSYDKSVRVWEIESGHEIGRLLGHTDLIIRVRWSQDERLLCSAGIDGVVKVWRTPTLNGHGLRRLDCALMSAAFAPNGIDVVVTASDGSVLMDRPASDGGMIRFEGASRPVSNVAFSPDATLLFAADYDGRLNAWNLGTARLQWRTDLGDADGVNSISISPDGRWLATAHQSSAVRIIDAATHEVAKSLPGREARCPIAEFSRAGDLLAAAYADGIVSIWDTARFDRIRSIAAHGATIRALAFSPDGRTLATGCDDWVIRLWNPRTGELIHRLEGHRHDVFCVAFSPDGRFLASCDRGASIMLWDPVTGKHLAQLPGHNDMIFRLAFSPDGRTIASAAIDGTLRLQRLDEFRPYILANRQAFQN